jgi:hypothetical protein
LSPSEIVEFEEEKTGSSPIPYAGPPPAVIPHSHTSEDPTLEFQLPPPVPELQSSEPTAEPASENQTLIPSASENQTVVPSASENQTLVLNSQSDPPVSTSAESEVPPPYTAAQLSVPASQVMAEPAHVTTDSQTLPQPPRPKVFTVVGQVVQRNSVVRGIVVQTLQPPPLTAEALAANSIQFGGTSSESKEEEEEVLKRSDHLSSTSSTLYAPKSTEHRAKDYSIVSPFRSLVESLQTISEGMTGPKKPEKRKVDELNIRDLYPRMPWHDVHGCLTGLPVRDLAAHFIQVIVDPFLTSLFLFLCLTLSLSTSTPRDGIIIVSLRAHMTVAQCSQISQIIPTIRSVQDVASRISSRLH